MNTKPFLKWVGGKSKLVDNILKFAPDKIQNYYEPFLGGGALFFSISGYDKALLNDYNKDLINTYSQVRDNSEKLLERLKDLNEQYLKSPEETYYNVRAKLDLDSINSAARFIFLNKAGFNGLYRVNSKGIFNVPWGKHKAPPIYNPDLIIAASKKLKQSLFTSVDFELAVKDAKAGDFVYFDPPYVPLNNTSNFTKYIKDGFSFEDQKRLVNCCFDLTNRGVIFVASNSDTDYTNNLYSKFEIFKVNMRRSINSKGNSRGPVSEILVSNRNSLKYE